MKIPVITTASEPNGTNGPLMPEIHEFAPHAAYVARKGEVNAWDNEDFVKTVRATSRKTLIIAGVWTSVCVMFPALDAKVAGYKVYAVMDASGDVSEMANRTTLARFVQGASSP
jgi:nicotinamidase-related amidase